MVPRFGPRGFDFSYRTQGAADRKPARTNRSGETPAASSVKLENNLYTDPWYVGQWQNGRFSGVGPVTKAGAHPVVFPKPPWHAQH
jgi:hypothetical protein